MKILQNKNIYLVISSAKKCSIMPNLISEFIEEGARVYTFITEMTKKLVDLRDLNIRGNHLALDYSKTEQELPLEDIVLIAPCTFNTLNKISQGIADSYPLTIIASAIGKKKKIIVAPAMNQFLWGHPQVSQSLEILQSWGCQIVWPEINENKVTMAPLEKIADTIYNCFSRIKYHSEKLPTDEEYNRTIEEHFSEFRFIGESLLEEDLIKGSAGFISKKVKEGILVSATGSNVGNLSKGDIALVVGLENGTIIWKGEKHPSSEMPIISEIYQAIPEAKAIIHTHGRKLTYNLAMQKYASAEYLRYGKFGELGKIVNTIKMNNGFGIMKLHGELCIGNSLYDALHKLKEKLEDVK